MTTIIGAGHRMFLGALGCLCALITNPADATPMYEPVTKWGYTLTSDWTAATFDDQSTLATPSDSLSWGTGGKSSLTIANDPATGSVDTWFGIGPVPFGVGNTYEHNNQPISPPFLDSATLSSSLTLDPQAPVTPFETDPIGDPIGPSTIEFDVSFVETINAEPCDDKASPIPCNDIFVIQGSFQNIPLVLDDRLYLINIFPVSGGGIDPFVPLAEDVCAAAGEPVSCLGFTTPEGEVTNVQFGFSVTTEPLNEPLDVPEPGLLSLMALGLLGLGAVRWRRYQI